MPARIDEALIDTSLLRSQATRRFLTAWWELRGQKILLTPETVVEMRRQLPQAALTEWSRRLNDQDPEQSADPQAQRLRIVKAVGRATVQWLDDELRDREGLYETRALTPDEEERAFLIETVLDGRPEVSYGAHERSAGGRKIIAQARAMGRRVVVTNNQNSLRPKHLREILESIGFGHGKCALCRCTRAGRPRRK